MRLPSPSRRGRLVVSCALAVGVALAVTELVPALPTRDLDIRVDLKASSGSRLALFHNDSGSTPQTRLIQRGRRVGYLFDGPSGDLEGVRVEIRDARGAELVFYGISVVDDRGKVVATSPPLDLRYWTAHDLTSPGATADSYVLKATGSTPVLEAAWIVAAPSSLPGPFEPVVRALKDPMKRLQVCLLALAAAGVAFAFLSRRLRPAALLALVLTPTVLVVFDVVLSHPYGVLPASEALGRSTYLGLSMPTNVRALWLMYAAGIALAVAAAMLLAGWRRGGDRSVEDVGEPAGPRRVWDWVGVGVAAVAALGYFVPDLARVLRDASTWTFPPGWDAENILAWNEFAARGLVPMRDFWYPYGNFLVFQAGLLKGVVALAVYHLILLAGYWWVFWIGSGRRFITASAGLVGLILAQPILYEFNRYGFGLLLALAYVCIDPRGRRLRDPARLVFAALTTLALFLDPALVAYAAFGLAAVLGVDLVRGWRLGARWWLSRLASDFALPAAGLVVVAVIFAVRDQLRGFLDLYTSLGLQAVFSAEPTVLMNGIDSALDLTVIVVWIPPVLFGLGLFLRLADERPVPGYTLGSALIALGAVALPMLLKHSLRTIAPQLLLFPIVATILFLLWASLRPARWYAVGALTGLAVAILLGFNGPDRTFDGVRALPARTYDDARVVLVDREARDRARAERFADARFVSYVEETKVADALRRRPLDDTDVYVLGDAPVIYSLLRQRPPWQIVLYATAPLEEQRRAIDWLEEKTPRYVVLDRLNPVFDDVPQDVRAPLVYQYVMRHYRFTFGTGAYDVLIRSQKANPADDYWPTTLASEVNLGRTPDVSSYDDPEPCKAGEQDCGVFLVARAPRDGWSGQVDVPLRFLRHTIVVRFLSSGSTRYTIPLARTWAWAISRTPTLGGKASAGWRVRLVRGRQPPDVLY